MSAVSDLGRDLAGPAEQTSAALEGKQDKAAAETAKEDAANALKSAGTAVRTAEEEKAWRKKPMPPPNLRTLG